MIKKNNTSKTTSSITIQEHEMIAIVTAGLRERAWFKESKNFKITKIIEQPGSNRRFCIHTYTAVEQERLEL